MIIPWVIRMANTFPTSFVISVVPKNFIINSFENVFEMPAMIIPDVATGMEMADEEVKVTREIKEASISISPPKKLAK
jgi:hypothetical protein